MKSVLVGFIIVFGFSVANNQALGVWRWPILLVLALALSTAGVIAERWWSRRQRPQPER